MFTYTDVKAPAYDSLQCSVCHKKWPVGGTWPAVRRSVRADLDAAVAAGWRSIDRFVYCPDCGGELHVPVKTEAEE